MSSQTISAQELGKTIRLQQERVERAHAYEMYKASVIEAWTFQLSSDLGVAAQVAREEFNAAVQPYSDRAIDRFSSGGPDIVRLGRSGCWPKVYVTARIRPKTCCIEITCREESKVGETDRPTVRFPLDVNDNMVIVTDGVSPISPSEFAAKLVSYFA